MKIFSNTLHTKNLSYNLLFISNIATEPYYKRVMTCTFQISVIIRAVAASNYA